MIPLLSVPQNLNWQYVALSGNAYLGARGSCVCARGSCVCAASSRPFSLQPTFDDTEFRTDGRGGVRHSRSPSSEDYSGFHYYSIHRYIHQSQSKRFDKDRELTPQANQLYGKLSCNL